MSGSPERRPQPTLPGLPHEVADAVRIPIGDLLERVLLTIIASSPYLEIHRGSPPPPRPRNSDEALELLRASAHLDTAIRRRIADDQALWALIAVLHNATQTEIGDALGLGRSTVAKRWTRLGKIRPRHRWLFQGENAQRWARMCVRLRESLPQLRFTGETRGAGRAEVGKLGQWARAYLDTLNDPSGGPGGDTWFVLALGSPALVESVIGRGRIKASGEQGEAALAEAVLVWRAYRAGVSVQDQLERDEQARARRVAPSVEG